MRPRDGASVSWARHTTVRERNREREGERVRNEERERDRDEEGGEELLAPSVFN